ncbi:MAG: hypothetical protein HRU15_18775 [Planctomycetes bacterium]|nr:hypothetical protein [Planctomycetota bacterium]
MTESNPYEAPEFEGNAIDNNEYNIEKVRSGQKLILYSILVYFLAIVLQIAIGPIAGLLMLVTFILGLIGTIRLTRGLNYSVILTILLVIVMMIPLIGLLVLLSLNGRATKILKESGYKVGLLGASGQPAPAVE